MRLYKLFNIQYPKIVLEDFSEENYSNIVSQIKETNIRLSLYIIKENAKQISNIETNERIYKI